MAAGTTMSTTACSWTVRASGIASYVWREGVMTFLVSDEGTLYQKNLGLETARIVSG
jgi:hypothetical protein